MASEHDSLKTRPSYNYANCHFKRCGNKRDSVLSSYLASCTFWSGDIYVNFALFDRKIKKGECFCDFDIHSVLFPYSLAVKCLSDTCPSLDY